MGTYRKEWDCCGSATETDGWEPEACPFCRTPVADGAALDLPPLPAPNAYEPNGREPTAYSRKAVEQIQREAISHYLRKQAKEAALQEIIDIGQEIENSGRKQAGQVGTNNSAEGERNAK